MIKYVIQIPFQEMVRWEEYKTVYTEVICDTEQEINKIVKTLVDNDFIYNNRRVEGMLYTVMRDINIETFQVKDKILHQIKCSNYNGSLMDADNKFIRINPNIESAKKTVEERLEQINTLVKNKGDLTIDNNEYIREIIYRVGMLDISYDDYKDKRNAHERYEKARWWE